MPINYGVIGCGSIARHRHVPEGHANRYARIVALTDPVKGRAQEVADQYDGASVYADHKQMLKEAEIDAVVVCTPNSLHAPISIDAFKAGKHVLVEKPMATTRADAKKMIAQAKKANKYLMIGLNQRLMPAHQKAKQILKSGELGKVISFKSSFKHPGPDGWSIDGAKSWFFDPKLAVMGCTGDLGVHKADLMRWMLGQEFTHVGGLISTLDKRDAKNKPIRVDDNACLTLKTDKGVIGTIEVAWTNYGSEDNMTVVYCQKGVMYLGTDPEYGVIVQHRNGNRDLHKVGVMATNKAQVASGIIDAFTDAIRKNKAPAIDGEEGYRCLDIILTSMEAADAGVTKKINYNLK